MEAVGRLAGGVAHDFNNLLTVITGRAALLLMELPADDPKRRDIDLITQTADRASALTRQLLALSRKQVLQPRILDLNELVESLEPILQRLIGEHIELHVLPAAGAAAVKADPTQIEQVLLNLTVNARDAMPAGGTLTIELSQVPAGQLQFDEGDHVGPGVSLVVRDSGHGHDAGRAGAHVRAVLHDQRARQGHRARARHRLRHHQAERRLTCRSRASWGTARRS